MDIIRTGLNDTQLILLLILVGAFTIIGIWCACIAIFSHFHKWGPWIYDGPVNYLDSKAHHICSVCDKREDTVFFRYL